MTYENLPALKKAFAEDWKEQEMTVKGNGDYIVLISDNVTEPYPELKKEVDKLVEKIKARREKDARKEQ